MVAGYAIGNRYYDKQVQTMIHIMLWIPNDFNDSLAWPNFSEKFEQLITRFKFTNNHISYDL